MAEQVIRYIILYADSSGDTNMYDELFETKEDACEYATNRALIDWLTFEVGRTKCVLCASCNDAMMPGDAKLIYGDRNNIAKAIMSCKYCYDIFRTWRAERYK